MYIRTADKLLLLLKQKTGREKRGVVVALKEISMCVDLFYRVDYSLVEILEVGVREETVA